MVIKYSRLLVDLSTIERNVSMIYFQKIKFHFACVISILCSMKCQTLRGGCFNKGRGKQCYKIYCTSKYENTFRLILRNFWGIEAQNSWNIYTNFGRFPSSKSNVATEYNECLDFWVRWVHMWRTVFVTLDFQEHSWVTAWPLR